MPPAAISSNNAYRPTIRGAALSSGLASDIGEYGAIYQTQLAIGNVQAINPRFSTGMGPSTDIPPKLPRSFFTRSSPIVARALVGQLLVSRIGGGTCIGKIVETEAYLGPRDAAAHSYRGRRTKRTEIMFGPAGYVYVFLLYGVHHAFNIVTARADQPQAVLIRALEPLIGATEMAGRRGVPVGHPNTANGPGKVCQALGISMEHYGCDVTQGVISVHRGRQVRVVASPRVGIDYAGEWIAKPWRFSERGSSFVSRPRPDS